MEMINIAMVGCGGFAREMHLPNLRTDGRFRVRAAVDANLEAAQAVAQMENAPLCTQDIDEALADPQIQAVFIVTPHHLHADYAIRAAQAGKHIFCEKPMGLNETECLEVAEAVRAAGVKYTAGYNRSIAPFTLQARELIASLDAPVLIYHRMADWFPYSRGWLIEEKFSGGRVIGESGHALDMICRLMGKDPVRVYAEGGNLVGQGAPEMPDSAIITLGFPGGSSGVMFLSSIANNGFPKEEVQITCANHTIVIDNFKRMYYYTPEGQRDFIQPKMDKGQAQLVQAFANAILTDTETPNGVESALRTSRCTFAALRSLRTHQVQAI